MRLSTRRFLYALIIVLAWFGFLIDGTQALFRDQALLKSNTISSGTAALLISNSQNASSTIYEHERPGFSYTLSPGQYEEKYLLLKNASGSDVSFDLEVQAVVQGVVNSELLYGAEIYFEPVDEQGVATGAAVGDSLYTLAQYSKPINVRIPKGVVQRLRMRTGLQPSVENQGLNLSYDLVFTGVQVMNDG
jgi:hypothetical protein